MRVSSILFALGPSCVGMLKENMNHSSSQEEGGLPQFGPVHQLLFLAKFLESGLGRVSVIDLSG